jgi:hypothetical protein
MTNKENDKPTINEINNTSIKKETKDQEIDAVERIDPSQNICRKMTNIVNDLFNLKALRYTQYFTEIHEIFIFLVSFVGLFNNNIAHLSVLLLIISLDAVSIVMLHECPLTTMEKKYLNTSSCDVRREAMANLGIMYNCDHEYEKQVELLINAWMLVSGKMLFILFLKTLNIKLTNYNNIYTDNTQK